MPSSDRRPGQKDRSSHRKGIVRILRVALAFAILGTLLAWIGPEQVLSRLTQLPAAVVLTVLTCALLIQWLASIRLRVLAHSQRLPLGRFEALAINLAAIFYGLFLPGGSATGWIVRILRLSSDPSRIGAALVALTSDRLFATGIGAALGLVADVFLGSPATPAVSLTLVGVVAAAGAVGLAAWTPAASGAVRRLERWPAIGPALSRLVRNGGTVRRPGPAAVVLATLLTVATHVVGITIWWLLARALGMEVDVVTIAWVRSLALVAGLLPATIAGLGIREGAVVYLMSLFGYATADALSLSLSAFATTVLAMGILGGLCEAGRLVRHSGNRTER